MTRDADALVGLFAVDGVLESPLIPLATITPGGWRDARRSVLLRDYFAPAIVD